MFSNVVCPGCSQALYQRADDSPKGKGASEYLVCENPRCTERGKKYARPTVELHPAAPAVVERVDRAIEEEKRQEREWHQREYGRPWPHDDLWPGKVFPAAQYSVGFTARFYPPRLISWSINPNGRKW